MSYQAVLFDLGGVVLGSPLHAIADYEREIGIAPNFINLVVANTAQHGGWARLERGEISMEEFYDAFEHDCREAGEAISAREMMLRMSEATKPSVCLSGKWNTVRRVSAVRMARSEYRRWPPGRPLGEAFQAASASSSNQSVTSPRFLSAAS